MQRNNSIVVSCESPVKYAFRKHRERRIMGPVLPTCPPPEQRGQCHVNMIRKMPCSFGWDWGPSFPSTGIWKPIELEAYDGAAIRDVTVTTVLQRMNDGVDRWVIEVGVFFTLSRRASKNGTILISLDDTFLVTSAVNFNNLKDRRLPFEDYSGRVKVPVVIPDDANMNMIRVWGGGIYETDYFYSLADELGILIWQDLMFSVSLYPADKAFLRSVAVEVKQQVRRLQHHPCLIVWAGNNENENDLFSDVWGDMINFLDDYRKLYVYTVKTVIDREEMSRPFLSSSPSNGRDGSPFFLNTSIPAHLSFNNVQDIWTRGSPNSETRGDVHFYQYWENSWEPSLYPIPRFVSEFGLLSYPSAETMGKVSPESTLVFPFSPFLASRQRHSGGYQELRRALEIHFGIFVLDLNVSGTEDAYAMVSYLSQVSVRTGCESFRRWRGYLEHDGRGHTMGVLFWQLNDIWQAPSWSSIEYGGRWKMLHYFAKKFFSPVLVSPFINGTDLRVFVVNDKRFPLEDVSLSIIVYKWTSFVSSHSMGFRLTVPAASSLDAVNIKLDSLWNISSCSSAKCFLWFTLEDTSTKSLLAPEAYVLPVQPADALLRRATITLLADNVALFVWLDSQALSGRFSDNGFLLKDPAKVVQFTTSDSVTPEQLQKAIVIYTVSDCTAEPHCPLGIATNETLYDLQQTAFDEEREMIPLKA
ncbi:hypothetical protein HPB49_015839 [Dermacentor silvarum]|uniref:Uncharacterized protein n=1 Tax=Dermacentor silvarum TaxID=543639 RepID=A0ACB8CLJ8_DERSI|nr:hypothetical protein HPB49_015839 [Dermacentor silvarum]